MLQRHLLDSAVCLPKVSSRGELVSVNGYLYSNPLGQIHGLSLPSLNAVTGIPPQSGWNVGNHMYSHTCHMCMSECLRVLCIPVAQDLDT